MTVQLMGSASTFCTRGPAPEDASAAPAPLCASVASPSGLSGLGVSALDSETGVELGPSTPNDSPGLSLPRSTCVSCFSYR